MTDKIDIEAIRKRWAGPSFKVTIPDDITADITALLAHIAALKAAHEAELLEVASFACYYVTGEEWPGLEDDCGGNGEDVIAAYRAYLSDLNANRMKSFGASMTLPPRPHPPQTR